MNRGRVILDARYLRGAPGGVVSYTEALIEHLPSLLPDVPIILIRHSAKSVPLSCAPNVTEWILGGEPNSPWSYFRLGRWLKARLDRHDLFHAPYRILPKGLDAKSVITMHDVMYIVCPELVFPHPLVRSMIKKYWSLAIRDAIRRADRIVAVSHYSADDILRLDSSCASRLRVTLLGKSPAFRPMEKACAERVSSSVVPPGQRFFLVLGGGSQNKNHVGAVSAFAKAFRVSDGIHLLVIERARTLPRELRQALRHSQLEERINVRAEVRTEELIALYNRAEALVFPSLYEGFGLPVLEAMACGCPVICSNVTSLPEVVGDAALSFAPQDENGIAQAMRRVVADADLRQSLSARGIQRAAMFDWKRMAIETVSIYREIATWLPASQSVK